MKWFDSFLYLCFISVLAFPLGRLIPKEWVHYERFPYLPYKWEDNGKIYGKLEIRRWMNKLPDMSRIFPSVMKRRELTGNYTSNDVRELLDETCVAEFIHTVLCFLGLFCMDLWPGSGGMIFYIFFVTVFQLPYILIQRYNRPRLAKVYRRMTRERSVSYESTDSELQYRRRS